MLLSIIVRFIVCILFVNPIPTNLHHSVLKNLIIFLVIGAQSAINPILKTIKTTIPHMVEQPHSKHSEGIDAIHPSSCAALITSAPNHCSPNLSYTIQQLLPQITSSVVHSSNHNTNSTLTSAATVASSQRKSALYSPYMESNADRILISTAFDTDDKDADDFNALSMLPQFSQPPTATATAERHSNVFDYIQAQEQYGNCLDNDTNADCTSPYRTYSHFGFNSPRREARPLHFHSAAATATTQYVPLPLALSIGELFASGRVLHCSDAEVPELLRCAIGQRPPLSRVSLPEPRYPKTTEEEKQQASAACCQTKDVEGQLSRAEFLRRMCQLEMHFSSNESCSGSQSSAQKDAESNNIICATAAAAEINAVKDAQDPVEADNDVAADNTTDSDDCACEPKYNVIRVTAEVHFDASNVDGTPDEPTNKAFSLELIDTIFENIMVADKENICHNSEADIIATDDGRPNAGNTFLRKIAAMTYSSESPNLEYQVQRKSVDPPLRPLHERQQVHDANAALASTARPLMMRQERLQRHEQFVDMWQEQLLDRFSSMLPAGQTDATEDDTACNDNDNNPCAVDRSLFEPMEQDILQRIDEHALVRRDPIYGKIRNTIIEYNTSKNSCGRGGTPIKVPSSTPTYDLDTDGTGAENSSDGRMFGSTIVSSLHSSDREANEHNGCVEADIERGDVLDDDMVGVFDSMDKYFQPNTGRNSSTPKSSKQSSVSSLEMRPTQSIASKTPSTLNVRRSTARWAANRSASRLNGSQKSNTDSTLSPAAKRNVSKARSFGTSAAATVVGAVTKNTVNAAQSSAPNHRTPRKRAHQQPKRNFIQENILKASQRSKIARTATSGSMASSSASSMTSLTPKPRIVVPTLRSDINSPAPVRSNATSIFGRNPFGVNGEHPTRATIHQQQQEQQLVADDCCDDVATKDSDRSAASLLSGTVNELNFSHDNNDDDEVIFDSSSDDENNVAIAAIQQNITKMLHEMEANDEQNANTVFSALDAETARMQANIERCDAGLAALHLGNVNAEMAEVEELYDQLQQDGENERIAEREQLNRDWSRYQDMVHALEIEED